MTEEADEDPEGIAGEMAYVALVHGSDRAFYLYTLLLGHRLWRLDPETSSTWKVQILPAMLRAKTPSNNR